MKHQNPNQKALSRISPDEWESFIGALQVILKEMLLTFETVQQDYAINEREAFIDGMSKGTEVVVEALYEYFFPGSVDNTH